MTIRTRAAKYVAEAWKLCQQGFPVNTVFKELLVDLLADQERAVLEYLETDREPRTSQDIAGTFGWQLTHASTILKRLYELDLLTRDNPDNQEYWYQVKEWK